MKPRDIPTPAREGHRYWTVDLNTEGSEPSIYKGPHLFKAPLYSTMFALRDAYIAAGAPTLVDSESRILLRHIADAEAVLGAFIGACWASRVWALETEPPKRGADVADWLAYGEAVQEELQDVEGFDVTTLHQIGVRCLLEVNERVTAPSRAADRADFSSGRPTRPEPTPEVEKDAPAESTLAPSGTS